MNAQKKFKLALVGTDSLRGKEIKNVLARRKLAAFRDACSASSISVFGKDEIFVGQIKKADQFPRAFWFWLVADNLTRGSALNAFEIAKKILAAGRSS